MPKPFIPLAPWTAHGTRIVAGGRTVCTVDSGFPFALDIARHIALLPELIESHPERLEELESVLARKEEELDRKEDEIEKLQDQLDRQ